MIVKQKNINRFIKNKMLPLSIKKINMIEPFSINIVCLGSWNRKIFTPNWVSTTLFNLPKGKEFQGVVNPVELEFGFLNQELLLLPKDNSLEIKLETINSKTIKYAPELLNKILTLLPHTPIKGIGINIRFDVSKDSEYSLISSLKSSTCSYNDFSLKQVKFVNSTKDYVINLIADIFDDKYQINFNFHYASVMSFDNQIVENHINEAKKILNYGNL